MLCLHLDKWTACWPSLPAKIYLTNYPPQKWCNLPIHKHQRDWAEKIELAMTNPPPSILFFCCGWFTSSVTRLGDLLDFLKPSATINLPKSVIFLGIFCKGVKIYHVPSEIIFGQLF